jgi:hypothetical protein
LICNPYSLRASINLILFDYQISPSKSIGIICASTGHKAQGAGSAFMLRQM